jgi:hypothetical protein
MSLESPGETRGAITGGGPLAPLIPIFQRTHVFDHGFQMTGTSRQIDGSRQAMKKFDLATIR